MKASPTVTMTATRSRSVSVHTSWGSKVRSDKKHERAPSQERRQRADPEAGPVHQRAARHRHLVRHRRDHRVDDRRRSRLASVGTPPTPRSAAERPVDAVDVGPLPLHDALRHPRRAAGVEQVEVLAGHVPCGAGAPCAATSSSKRPVPSTCGPPSSTSTSSRRFGQRSLTRPTRSPSEAVEHQRPRRRCRRGGRRARRRGSGSSR